MKRTRRVVQLAFLGLVLVGVFALEANCERWCPFGGVEAIYTYATEGNMVCSLGVSNFYILGGVLVMTLLLRRAFCGYMCPIGAISEGTNWVGRKLRLPQASVPQGLDRVMSLMKYVVLFVILYFTYKTSELVFRGFDPCYALISRHGVDITIWAYVVAGAILVGSLMIMVPFCRWFCPLAAVMHPFSRFGLVRVRRDTAQCSNCGLCAKQCPMGVPVDQLVEVTAARCTSCMNCIDACPQKRSDALAWGPPRLLGTRWSQALLLAIMFGCTAVAVGASYLFPMPSFVKSRGTPPDEIATVDMQIEGVRCRGRGNLLFWFIERDDMYQLPGYLRVEAWPGPSLARVKVSFDQTQTNQTAIKQAITEPYYEILSDYWRMSPFRIVGYDPLSAPLPENGTSTDDLLGPLGEPAMAPGEPGNSSPDDLPALEQRLPAPGKPATAGPDATDR